MAANVEDVERPALRAVSTLEAVFGQSEKRGTDLNVMLQALDDGGSTG